MARTKTTTKRTVDLKKKKGKGEDKERRSEDWEEEIMDPTSSTLNLSESMDGTRRRRRESNTSSKNIPSKISDRSRLSGCTFIPLF